MFSGLYITEVSSTYRFFKYDPLKHCPKCNTNKYRQLWDLICYPQLPYLFADMFEIECLLYTGIKAYICELLASIYHWPPGI